MHPDNKVISRNLKKNPIMPIILIFLVSLAIRFLYFAGIQNNDIFQAINSTLDSRFYDNWAQTIIKDGWLGKEVFFMNPGYPYFIAILYSVFGTTKNIIFIIQFIIGSLTCVFVYLIAKKIFNFSIALVSGFILAFYGISIFYEGMLVTTTLIAFLNIFIIFLLLQFDFYTNPKTIIKLFIIGFLLGISALVRPNVLLFSILIPAFILWKAREHFGKLSFNHLKYIVIFLFGIFVAIFPVTMRNYVVSKEFVITTSGAGMNFYMGNNPQANGSYKVLGFASSDPRYEGEDFRKEASRIVERDLTLAESSAFWFNRSLEFISRQPFDWLKLILLKLILFWNAYEIPGNFDYYFLRQHSSILRIPLLSFGLICPLSLLGIFLSRFYWKENLLLYGYVFGYLIINLMFFVLSEYRFPIIQVLIIYASFSILWIIEKIKKKEFQKVCLSLLALIVIGMLININQNNKVSFAVSYNNLGNAYADLGMSDKAQKMYNLALAKEPRYYQVNLRIGNLYFKNGQYEKAIEEYEKVLKTSPNNKEACFNLGVIYMKQNKYDLAISFFDRTIKIQRDFVEAYFNIARIYSTQKKYDKSIVFFKKAIKINPDIIPLHYNLAIIYERKGMLLDALKEYEEIMKINPEIEQIKKRYENIIKKTKRD